MQLPSRAFLVRSSIALLIIFSLGWGFQSRFRIGIDTQSTLSMIDRVFLIDIKDRAIERDKKYVFVVTTAIPIYDKGTELIKRVVGLPGDTVTIDEHFNILVNNSLVAKGLWHLQDIDQKLVKQRFVGSRILAADEFWVMGFSEKSFDSRYFGPIHADQIKGKAYGLF